jgi:hypothetical protein
MRNNEADIFIHPVNVRCRQRHINQAMWKREKEISPFKILVEAYTMSHHSPTL